MNKSQKILNSIFIFSAISLLLLTGCSKQRDINILQNLHSRPFDFEEEKDNAKVGIKVLSEKEFSSTFPTAPARKKKQVYKDYKVILMNLVNKSDYLSYLINPKNIGFPFAKAEEIFEKLKVDTKSTSYAYVPFLMSLLILAPLDAFILGAMIWAVCSGNPAVIFMAILPFIIITEIILSTFFAGKFKYKRGIKKIDKRNKYTFESLKNKIFDFEQTEKLKPNRKINKLFFINKKDLKPEFTIKLFNQIQQNYLEFNVPYLTQLAYK